ncbi:MAG TPA: ComEC/Rec2 family competence protein [Opitutus sp.]|nr:ComEC/Rec2 family competence protein [Opitutus sp.]
MPSRSLGHRAPLLWIVLPLMAGLAAGRMGEFAPASWLLAGALAAVVIAIAAGWRGTRWFAPAIGAAMFCAGAASYLLHRPRIAAWDALPPREARVVLRIERTFPQMDTSRASGIARVVRAEERLQELAGQRVYFSLALKKSAAAPIRSAVVSAFGVVASLPRDPPADTFDGYLANNGVNFRLTRGRILAEEQPPSRYRRFCARAADKLNDWLGAGIATKRPDLAAVYRAMMLGQKHELSDEQDTLFMQSGTMHLFAINGLHIGVVAVALHALLMALRCPRPLAAVLMLAVLWLDVDTTGTSPSAVRAFVLVACYEAALVLRRPANGLAALATAAALVLLFDPMALFGASFQMSYGVVLAILCFGLPLAEQLAARFAPFKDLPEAARRWWQRGVVFVSSWFWPVLGIGIAAALVSTICGPQFFHVWAPGGLIANLVLVPLAMLVIVAGFASVVAGLVGVTALGALFNHAALVLLVVIDGLIRAGVHAPAVWWTADWRTPWLASSALALLAATLLAGYAAGWRGWARGYWAPFAAVAAMFLLGVKIG